MSNYKTPPSFLRRALDSMLDQTMPDFEAVIINDGMKDESYDVLLEYAAKDSRIRLIENEQNLGLPASLNRGIAQCKGKYIARMDTDDICLPDRLEKQVDYLEKHPDVMFLGAGMDVFDENENEPYDTWIIKMCPQEEYRIRLLFANDPVMFHPTVMFRTEFLRKNNLLYSEDPRYRYSEDYEMWTRCADFGKADIMESPVLKYRNIQADNRITIRHADEMTACIQNIHKKLLARLDIDSSEYDYDLHYRLLCGRKPYSLSYKKWMNRILHQNRIKRVYDQATLRRMLHDRWYNIVYYGIAHKKTLKKRIKCFLTFYPDAYIRFFKEILRK